MKSVSRQAPPRQTDTRGLQLQGLGLALLTAVISGAAVFLAGYGVRAFPDPALYAAVRNTLVGAALLILALRPTTLGEVRRLTPRQGLGLLVLGIIGGSVPFVLFFEGLSGVASGNAAFIHKTLFLWVAVLALVFLRERLGMGQVAALGVLLVAHVLLGGPGALQPGPAEAMVLTATLLWSIEVVLARRLLTGLSSLVGATARMSIGAAILLSYLAATGQLGVLWHLSLVQWAWAAGPSVLLLGYVTTWYAALKRAPATAVTCILTLGAPITAALTALAGGPWPAGIELVGYGLLLVAVMAFAALALRQARPQAGAAATGAP